MFVICRKKVSDRECALRSSACWFGLIEPSQEKEAIALKANRKNKRKLSSFLNKFGEALVNVTSASKTGMAASSLVLASMAMPTVADASDIAADALPTGADIVSGGISINSDGAVMDITQSQTRGIINWDTFNVGEDAAVNFYNGAGMTLNRVVGNDVSHVLGKITATGDIMLVNSNGVFFGSNARVDAASMVATTSDIRNEDFMAGNMTFTTPGGATASIINHGTISVKDAGLVGLVAPNVENHGVINAKLGRVELASADMFTLDMYGDGLISVGLSDDVASQLVDNSGTINAEGGVVAMTAASARNAIDQLVTVSGDVNVSSVTSEGGKIVFSAEGTDAGYGEVRLDGATLDASSGIAKGGDIDVFGNRIILKNGTEVNADGATGGGEVRVGGDYLGSGDMLKADYTIIDNSSYITADATDNGDGGRIIVWSDLTTQFYGNAYARGGVNGGDGGFIETSGKDTLVATGVGHANARLDGYTGGEWLLDPANITITDSGLEVNISGDPDWTSTGASAVLLTSSIESALNLGTSVTVQTGNPKGVNEDGDIVINGDIEKTGGGNASLTLLAHDDIIIAGADITSISGELDVTLNTDTDGGGGGAALIATSTIDTNGGDFTVGGGSDPSTTAAEGDSTYAWGVYLAGLDLDTGIGDISIRGIGDSAAASNVGVYLATSTSLTTSTGSIYLNGQGGAGTDTNYGVQMNGATIETTAGGNIDIDATGGGDGTGSSNYGMYMSGVSTITTSVTGNIDIDATGGSGNDSDGGFYMTGSTTNITVDNGNLTIDGTGGGNGDYAEGIGMYAGASIDSTGTGDISLTGTASANGGAGSNGIQLDDADITTANGVLTIDGTSDGNDDDSNGVLIDNGSTITSTGTAGTVNITGTDTSAGNDSSGVRINGSGTLVTSGLADINITGNGSDTSLGNGIGVYIDGGADITSTSSTFSAAQADINITGTGGDGASSNVGVYLEDDGTTVTSDTANITIDGTGGATGSNSHGVSFANGADVTVASTGNITITGNAAGTGNDLAMASNSATNDVGGSTMTGNITLNIDEINGLKSGNSIETDGDITIQQRTNSTNILLGSGIVGGSTMQITQSIYNFFDFGRLILGSTTATGSVTSGTITHSAGDLTLRTSSTGSAFVNADPSLSSGSDLTIDSGNVYVNDTITMSGGGNLDITGSTAVDINYDITSTGEGTVDITGGTIDTTGSTIDSEGAVTISGTTVTLDSVLTDDDDISITGTGATDLNGAITTGSGDVTVSGAGLTVDAAVTTTGGTLGLDAGSGTLDVNSALVGARGVDLDGGTVDIDATVDNTTSGDLDITSTGAVDIDAGITNSANNVNINGTDIDIDATVDSARNITIDGTDVDVNNALSASNNMSVTASSNLNISSDISGNNMIIGTSGVTAGLSGDITASGNVTVDGVITLEDDVTIDNSSGKGAITLEGTIDGKQALTLTGSLVNSGAQIINNAVIGGTTALEAFSATSRTITSTADINASTSSLTGGAITFDTITGSNMTFNSTGDITGEIYGDNVTVTNADNATFTGAVRGSDNQFGANWIEVGTPDGRVTLNGYEAGGEHTTEEIYKVATDIPTQKSAATSFDSDDELDGPLINVKELDKHKYNSEKSPLYIDKSLIDLE